MFYLAQSGEKGDGSEFCGPVFSPDEQMLFGTIHSQNVAAYRAALAAGRVDVGGEIVIPL